jgi:hypothetical protein
MNDRELLEYIELCGHASFEELERRFGDDVHQTIDRLVASGKAHWSLGGILSERQRRQNQIDEWWGAKREWEEFYRKRDEAKAFHRGPSDPDWEFVK